MTCIMSILGADTIDKVVNVTNENSYAELVNQTGEINGEHKGGRDRLWK